MQRPTSETMITDKIVASVCEAAFRGDAATVALCLGIEKQTSRKRHGDLDETLQASSAMAGTFHSRLFQSNSEFPALNRPEQVLRALLLIPPWYDTPWKAALAMVECFHTQSGFLTYNPQSRNRTGSSRRVLLTCITDVQSFLQQSVRAWLIPDVTTTSAAAVPVPLPASNVLGTSSTSSTPREMIQNLTQLVLQPFYSIQEKIHHAAALNWTKLQSSDHWLLPLELLPSLLSLCRALESDESLSFSPITALNYILNTIFANNMDLVASPTLRQDRLLQWLTLVSDVRSHLRPADWIYLKQTLQASLCQRQQHPTDRGEIPPDDFPGLVRTMVSFLSNAYNTCQKNAVEDDNDNVPSWEELILQLLYSASQSSTTTLFSTVEAVLKSSISSLSHPTLYQWMDVVIQQQSQLQVLSITERIPDWVHSNLQLMLLQASQHSGSQMVYNLVSQAFGNEEHENLERRGWGALISMAFPPLNTQTQPQPRHILHAAARRKRKHNMQHSEDVLNDVQQMMERAHYGGGGNFFEYDNAKSDSLSYCTSLICKSLFLGSTSHRTQVQGGRTRHSSFALERAQMWVHAAHSFLRTPSFASSSSNTPTQLSLQDILLTVLIIVTVYAEVSASRSSLVRTMLQSLSVEEDTRATSKSVLSAKLNCIVLSVIIRTMQQKNDFAKNLDGLEDLRPLSDVLSRALPKEVFFQLASALRSLPCARTAMLSVSRKYLQSPFSRGMGCTSIDTGRGAQNNNDRNEKAIYALCILILDFSKDEFELQTPGVAFSDECGREAWAILSDLIVLNKPSVPLSARRYLYQQLQSYSQTKTLSHEKLSRLLGACFVLFLQYFSSDKHATLRFAPERVFVSWGALDGQSNRRNVSQREDLLGLLRLIVSLLRIVDAPDNLAPEDGSDSHTNIWLCCRKPLLNLLSSTNPSLSATREDRMLQKGRHVAFYCDPDSDDTNLPIGIISSCCMSAVSMYLLNIKSFPPPLMDGSVFIPKDIGDLCMVIQLKLKLEEQRKCEHDAEYADDGTFCKLKRPKWVLSNSEPSVVREVTSDERRLLNPILSSLCDIMIEFVVYQDEQNNETNIDKEMLLSKSLCAVVAAKKSYIRKSKYLGKGGNIDTFYQPITFDRDIICKMGPDMFNVTAGALRNSIVYQQGHDLSEVEEILQTSLSCCLSVQNVILDDEFGSGVRIEESIRLLNYLWELYLVIGEEESCKRFIRYLEDKCLREASAVDDSVVTPDRTGNRNPCSLLAIKSDIELDAVVRHVRSILLSTLRCLFTSVSANVNRQRTDMSRNATKSFDREGPVKRPSDVTLSLCSNCITTLSLDLQLGVNGDSGGLTPKMFLAYLDLIECATNTIISKFRHQPITSFEAVWAASRRAALCLRDVVCRVTLKAPSLFKKTLLLSLYSLPSVYRFFLRSRCIQASDTAVDRLEPLDDFSVIVFDQCVHVLTRWSRPGTRLPPALWAEIAGIPCVSESKVCVEKTDIDDTNNGSEDLVLPLPETGQRDQHRIPSVVMVPMQQQDGNIEDGVGEPTEYKLNFVTPEILFSACSCALLSMEQNWMESYHSLQSKVFGQHNSDYESENVVRYSAARARELSRTIRVVCLVLSDAKIKGSNASLKLGEATVNFLALKLSNATKLRLCSLLNRISMVLKFAIRNLVNYVRNPGMAFDLSIVESFSCIIAWIFPENVDTDFTSGSRHWYQVEKQKESTTKAENCISTNEANDSILGRLPKVLFRMEELDWSSQKLSGICRNQRKSKVNDLDKFLGRVYESLFADQGGFKSSMSQLIDQKLKASAVNSDKFGIAFLDSFAGTNIVEAGKKRKKASQNRAIDLQMRKERRRKLKRSRNTVVDEMLHRDQEEGHDRGNDMDDAYVDLEDFLAEG